MANLINQALFRIDPTEGLLQYVQAVKPFHSKVLDVLVEYVYTEPLTVTAFDKFNLNIGLPVTDVNDPLRRSQTGVTYSRGYGYAYAAYGDGMVGGLPQATIISAQGPVSLIATVSGSTITTTIDDTGYTLTNDTLVSFSTSDTFPSIDGVPLAAGATYYVVGAAGNTCSISTTIGGAPLVFTSSGVGTLRIIPLDLPVNSFLFDVPTPVPYEIAVASVVNSQFLFATSYPVVGINGVLQQWRVTGDQTTTFTSGLRFYLNNNVDPNANKSYVVTTAVYDLGTNQTVITVQEPLSLSSTASGTISVAQTADDFPFWPAGSAIQFESTGTLPFPLQPATTYYVVPTTTSGAFQLSAERYPQRLSDVIDIFTLGTGILQATRVEPFLPGELVEVTGSYLGVNDGKYVLTRIEPEGTYFRAFTREFVEQTTPAGALSDGTMGFVGTYGDPVGDIVTSPQLYTATYFHERIDFQFGPIPLASYLYDGFSGIGNLSDHVADSGHTWNTFQFPDNLNQLLLTGDGVGGVTTSDPDIWARANWVPPASPTSFYVEVDLYVREHPGTGSPYFRMYTKEANLVDFYGPHIDIYPNLATGKIAIEMWLGDDTVGTFFTTDTTVNVNTTVTVRMEVVNQAQVRIYINGALIHTSAAVSWPELTFVGFNFRVPAGDPTQFGLNRIQADSFVSDLPPPVAVPSAIYIGAGSAVTAIDPTTGSIISTTSNDDFATYDRMSVWVNNTFWLADNLGRIQIFDPATNTYATPIDIDPGQFPYLFSGAVSPDQQFVYVGEYTNATSVRVWKINASTQAIVGAVTVPNYEYITYMVVSDDGSELYATGDTSAGQGGVLYINTTSMTVVDETLIGALNDGTWNVIKYNDRILVSCGTRVYEINPSTRAIVTSFEIPQDVGRVPRGLCIVGDSLWVGCGARRDLYEYSLPSYTLTRSFFMPFGSFGHELVLSNDGVTMYITRNGGQWVYAFNTVTNALKVGYTTASIGTTNGAPVPIGTA